MNQNWLPTCTATDGLLSEVEFVKLEDKLLREASSLVVCLRSLQAFESDSSLLVLSLELCIFGDAKQPLLSCVQKNL